MARTSEPLLAWLREKLKAKQLNTASVAEVTGLERGRVRKILAGAEPMLVDELMVLSDALQLDASDLTAQSLDVDPTPAAPADAPSDAADLVDPYGNQPAQLFRIAFAMGCDFLFVADTTQLEGSGVPGAVLRQYASGDLPIRLEAAYHPYNDPRYSEEGVTLTLSFDALYDCTFPWSSVKQVVLFPVAPEPGSPDDDEDDASDEAPAAGIPHLRLVT